MTFKSMKYLGINPKEEVQNCYTENYNIWPKELKDYLNKYL